MSAGGIDEQLVEAMAAIYGRHAGHRALHAKGTWARGSFRASPEAAAVCRAEHLGGAEVDALVRFSNASGDPQSHDADRDNRGIGVKLRVREGVETDILGSTSPAFITRTPEDFLEVLRLRRPDPATGQPDMERLGAYLAAHPEARTAVMATINSEPPASFATLTYFSPHAFHLLAADGARTWVRWRWQPPDGERRIPDDDARRRGRDYLSEELAERLAAGTVALELVLQLADEEDPLEDPTAVWPDERDRVLAGRLELSELVESPERDGHIDVFDPLRLIDGIEPSADPVLHARPRAYSVSAYRRWDRPRNEGGPMETELPAERPAEEEPEEGTPTPETGADEVPPSESLDRDAATERGDE